MNYLVVKSRIPGNRRYFDELWASSDYAYDTHKNYSSGVGGNQVYLGLVEARYDYQMSYLDEWSEAWRRKATKHETFNLAKDNQLKNLERKLKDLDLIVVLHSVSADSNSWLQKLEPLSHKSRAPMIFFVGNEFSSPFLSTELRLNLISQISPEVIASQLPSDCSSWLYEKTGSRVATAPPGIPKTTFRRHDQLIQCDLGYRGFTYPWYLLDNERNETLIEISEFFKSNNMKLDISYTHRFKGTEWFDFLRGARFTSSSEAGSRFIFRDDQVWLPIQEYFEVHHKFSVVENDANGMNILRKLPGPLKKLVREIAKSLGVTQASLYKPDSQEVQVMTELIDTSKFEYRNGKCISSRHLDAIACGTWQILKPGTYNEILKSEEHFTSWQGPGTEGLVELLRNPELVISKARNALETLREGNTYDARVSSLIETLR